MFGVKLKSNRDKKSRTVRQVKSRVQRIKMEWHQEILLLIYKITYINLEIIIVGSYEQCCKQKGGFPMKDYRLDNIVY